MHLLRTILLPIALATALVYGCGLPDTSGEEASGIAQGAPKGLAVSAGESASEPIDNNRIFNFEGTPLLWTSQGNIGLNSNASGGNQSLEITGCGWLEITSPAFTTAQVAPIRDGFKVDVFIPTNQQNPYWIGDVGFLMSIPSAGIYHQWFGQQLLNDLERGRWVEIALSLPDNIVSALKHNHTDVRLHLAVNTSSCLEPLLIDHFRWIDQVRAPAYPSSAVDSRGCPEPY